MVLLTGSPEKTVHAFKTNDHFWDKLREMKPKLLRNILGCRVKFLSLTTGTM